MPAESPCRRISFKWVEICFPENRASVGNDNLARGKFRARADEPSLGCCGERQLLHSYEARDKFAPTPTRDGEDEMTEEVEADFLQIDNI
jgi:hypothetical protein